VSSEWGGCAVCLGTGEGTLGGSWPWLPLAPPSLTSTLPFPPFPFPLALFPPCPLPLLLTHYASLSSSPHAPTLPSLLSSPTPPASSLLLFPSHTPPPLLSSLLPSAPYTGIHKYPLPRAALRYPAMQLRQSELRVSPLPVPEALTSKPGSGVGASGSLIAPRQSLSHFVTESVPLKSSAIQYYYMYSTYSVLLFYYYNSL